MIRQTLEVELTCPECLDQLDNTRKAFSTACQSTECSSTCKSIWNMSLLHRSVTLVLETLKAIEE